MNNKKGKNKPLLSPIIIFFIIIFVFSVSIMFFGCEEIPPIDSTNEIIGGDTDSSDINSSESQESLETEKNGMEEEEKDTEESESAGEDSSNGQEASEEQSGETTGEDNSEMISIDIYYTDSQAQYLVAEKRLVDPDNKYVNALLEMIKPPAGDGLVQLLPGSTVVNKVVVRDSIADVDLSADFIDKRFQSETVDVLLVYSIVNTLTEFPEVDGVMFYINGTKLDILGMIDIKGPIFRRDDLIKDK